LTTHGLSWLYVAMKRVGIAELKNNLSRHLRDVEGGEVVEVMDRARVIARIVPIEASPRSKLTILPARRPFSAAREVVHPAMDPPIDALALLLEDRAGRDWPVETN
jgi:antitoxin (DNA-binding transcriptional repressor) of toxin-antitoxin stability system